MPVASIEVDFNLSTYSYSIYRVDEAIIGRPKAPSSDVHLSWFHDYDSAQFSKVLKILAPPAPPCPNCEAPLDRLEGGRYPDSLSWDREKNRYVYVNLIPALTYTCPSCQKVIGRQFGEGNKYGFDPVSEPRQ